MCVLQETNPAKTACILWWCTVDTLIQLKKLPMPGMVSAMEPGNVPGHPYPPTKHFHRPLGRTTTWLDLWLEPTCEKQLVHGRMVSGKLYNLHQKVHKSQEVTSLIFFPTQVSARSISRLHLKYVQIAWQTPIRVEPASKLGWILTS